MEKFILFVEVPDEPPIYIGPFDTYEAARQYGENWSAGVGATARRMEVDTQWSVAPLEVPSIDFCEER